VTVTQPLSREAIAAMISTGFVGSSPIAMAIRSAKRSVAGIAGYSTAAPSSPLPDRQLTLHRQRVRHCEPPMRRSAPIGYQHFWLPGVAGRSELLRQVRLIRRLSKAAMLARRRTCYPVTPISVPDAV
jgi:hypothetical protein